MRSLLWIGCALCIFQNIGNTVHAQVQRSSNPHGFGVSANINIESGHNNAYIGTGSDIDINEPKNTSGAAREVEPRVQGRTHIKATQKEASSTAVGKDNNASNEAGIIGGR